MAQKSRVLIIGATGYMGKLMVEASVKSGHPTFALVRESGGSNPERLKLIDSFKNSGVAIFYGDTHHHENLVKVIKQVDVVICTAGFEQMSDQVKIIAAIKEAGNIKRFFPSEFTMDVDHVNAVEPASSVFAAKANVRRSIEAEGIPHTYVVCNAFLGHFLSNLGQTDASAPPRDKVVILGDGNTKATYVKEEDIATYTIKAVDDPRTLNKILYMRLPANTLSFNEIVSLWEKKIGKTLEKTFVLEDELLKKIQESSFPNNLTLSVSHSGFVKGYATNFEIDASSGLDAYEIYPDVKYTTVDEYLDQLV